LVQLVTLSTDKQLHDWLERGGEQEPASTKKDDFRIRAGA